jgi:hypothetical protein
MSASVGNTINHALPRLHDNEAISRDSASKCFSAPKVPSSGTFRIGADTNWPRKGGVPVVGFSFVFDTICKPTFSMAIF